MLTLRQWVPAPFESVRALRRSEMKALHSALSDQTSAPAASTEAPVVSA